MGQNAGWAKHCLSVVNTMAWYTAPLLMLLQLATNSNSQRNIRGLYLFGVHPKVPTEAVVHYIKY